jgi:hypothetical protein
MKTFLDRAVMQHHPLRALETFLEQESANELAQKYEAMRFVGYVLDIGYETITIITSDPFKISVGGIPRNSLLIMVPSSFERLPLHFTLLRVLESAPTPLTKEVQQTYFELQKKSMPELDVFTQSELQWGALNTGVLGMFYANPDRMNAVEFSGDLNNFVSAHKYRIYAPDDALLDLIVNALVPEENRFVIGDLRLTECRLPLPNSPQPQVKASVSTTDYMGTRTAMFGKTRLGKSNVVKLIAQSLLETTVQTRNVGQLIFDINGEYANDNPQDGSSSLRSGYAERCEVYAFTHRPNTPSKPLKLNFYEHPESALPILGSLLKGDNRVSTYIQAFTSVELPSLEELASLPSNGGDLVRPLRRVQIFWAILKKAGYQADEAKLLATAPAGSPASKFNPGFSRELRTAAYRASDSRIAVPPSAPDSLDTLVRELEVVNKFRRENQESDLLKSRSSGKPLFEPDDKALLEFFDPPSGRSGPTLLQSYRKYHHPRAGDFVKEILRSVDVGKTAILDLGNANPEVMTYFSDELSRAVFNHQVDKFTNDALGNHFIQLYFEEAHNLFPRNTDENTIYTRFAKEGAKYHIGMVYSTQSPTTISKDLLAQTENFFVAHLASRDDVDVLSKVNVAYESLASDILLAKTPGYMRMLTRSHRFVISVQAMKFMPPERRG